VIEIAYIVVFGVLSGITIVEYSIWRYKRATRKLAYEVASIVISRLRSDGDLRAKAEEVAGEIVESLARRAAKAFIAEAGVRPPPRLDPRDLGGDRG